MRTEKDLLNRSQMMPPKFATAVNCMDGRVQIPVLEYLKTRYGFDYVDMITEPGPARILARRKERPILDSIRKRIGLSLLRHGSTMVAVAGHHDCAGNPAAEEAQFKHIATAIKTIKSWRFDVRAIGLWVDKNWKAHEVPRPASQSKRPCALT